ncbi:hypothetical protein C1645_825782 [Glomus cerebriforme]|nr:hypothetical protein C1645_825782 [Glomus cerebriforme]
MNFEDLHIDTYDDVHQIIKNIHEKNEIALQLRCILLKLINITIQAILKLISIVSDGVANEYNSQLELIKGYNTNNFLMYKDEFYNINFSAPIYENRPIIRVQDPKHAKKNGRNNVHNDNSALYMRDVINVNKQDDGAAFRFFSLAHSNFG